MQNDGSANPSGAPMQISSSSTFSSLPNENSKLQDQTAPELPGEIDVGPHSKRHSGEQDLYKRYSASEKSTTTQKLGANKMINRIQHHRVNDLVSVSTFEFQVKPELNVLASSTTSHLGNASTSNISNYLAPNSLNSLPHNHNHSHNHYQQQQQPSQFTHKRHSNAVHNSSNQNMQQNQADLRKPITEKRFMSIAHASHDPPAYNLDKLQAMAAQQSVFIEEEEEEEEEDRLSLSPEKDSKALPQPCTKCGHEKEHDERIAYFESEILKRNEKIKQGKSKLEKLEETIFNLKKNMNYQGLKPPEKSPIFVAQNEMKTTLTNAKRISNLEMNINKEAQEFVRMKEDLETRIALEMESLQRKISNLEKKLLQHESDPANDALWQRNHQVENLAKSLSQSQMDNEELRIKLRNVLMKQAKEDDKIQKLHDHLTELENKTCFNCIELTSELVAAQKILSTKSLNNKK